MAGRIIDILKFVFFVLLIPLVVAVTVGLISEIRAQSSVISAYFAWGILTYLILHLFVLDLSGMYRYGHKLTSDIFRFFEPLVEFGPYFVPIYTLLILIAFYLVRLLFKDGWWDPYFIFFASFSFAMHLICAAHELSERDANALRPNYYFSIVLIYIVGIFVISLFLDVIVQNYSFPDFFKATSKVAKAIYSRVFGQLFGV